MRPAHAVDLDADDVAWFEKLAKTSARLPAWVNSVSPRSIICCTGSG